MSRGLAALCRTAARAWPSDGQKSLGQGFINDFRFGFNRLRVRGLQENVGDDVSSRLGIQGLRTDPIAVGRPGVRLGITDALIEPNN